MLLDFSDFSAHVSQYFILKSWMPLAPGHKSNKNPLFLRVRGYFQFFRIFLFHFFLNDFLKKSAQRCPVQSIRFILEIYSRDPKWVYFFQILSSMSHTDDGRALTYQLTNGRHYESNILADFLKIV